MFLPKKTGIAAKFLAVAKLINEPTMYAVTIFCILEINPKIFKQKNLKCE